MDLTVFIVAAVASYWYETEMFLFIGGLFLMGRFLYLWYKPLACIWPPDRCKGGRWVLGLLPAAAFAITLLTLLTMASFDVVGIWVVFYLVLLYAWLRGGLYLLEYALGMFCAYDTVYLNNKAAVFPVACGFLGLTMIYAGANTGDGPGWWVILISGGMGLAAWLGLAALVNLCARASEHITVDRDAGCGIRFGAYLLASGLLLAWASGGDWISLSATIEEFFRGLPVIPLSLFVILVERVLMRPQKVTPGSILVSVFWGFVYLAYAAVFSIVLPFLEKSPFIGVTVVIS